MRRIVEYWSSPVGRSTSAGRREGAQTIRVRFIGQKQARMATKMVHEAVIFRLFLEHTNVRAAYWGCEVGALVV